MLYFRYMDLERRTAEIIEGAEKALAELAAQAAAARDYSRATALLAIAQRIAEAGKPAEAVRAGSIPRAPFSTRSAPFAQSCAIVVRLHRLA